MEKIWALVATILLFLLFAFLFWRFIGMDAKKEYGTKNVETLANEIIFFSSLSIL